MATSPWDQFEAVTPPGAPGPNPPAGFDLVPLLPGDPNKPAQSEAELEGQRLRNRQIELEIEREGQKQSTGGTKGQESLDQKFSDDYAQWRMTGQSDATKALQQLTSSAQALQQKNITGPIIGSLPDWLTAYIAPDAIEHREAVEEVAQRNLRAILGGQFAAREGEQLIARAYNPRLPEATNRKRVLRLMNQMVEAAKQKESAAQYFEQHGTLKGWQGKLWSVDDFDPEVADDAPEEEQWRQPPGDIGFNTPPTDPRGNPLTPEQQAAYDAFLKNNPNAAPEDLIRFVSMIGGGDLDPARAKEIIDVYRETGTFAPGESAIQPEPDISDARGPEGPAQQDADAFVRGLADTASLGLASKGQAVVDMAIRGGTLDENLARQYAIDEYDRQNNFWLRTGGQVAGGAGLAPLFQGRTAVELAREGAVYGALYGAGSSERMADVPGGIVTGGVSGAVGGWGGAKLLGKLGGGTPGGGPGERYAAGQKFGMDLSVGDVRGMGSKATERLLDVQPGSASVMNAARGRLGEQTVEAVDNVARTFGPTTSHRGMGEAAQRGANKWISKFEEVSGKAYDAIPVSPKADARLSNTREALTELTTIFESNPKMAETFQNMKLNHYMEALDPTEGGGLSWKDLKTFRSRIGEEIGEQRFSDSPTKTELRRLYAALSEDMRQTATAQGPRALRAFQRANNLYRQGQERIDNALVQILGDDAMKNPEAAAAKLQTIVKEGKSSSDLRMVQDVWKSLPKEERGEVANGLIRLLGQPANAPGREFNPQTFIRNFDSMAPAAKNLIFGAESKALRQNLDEFTGVIRGLAANDSTRNTSKTAMGLAGLIGFGGGGVPGLLTQVVGSYGAARLWTNPRFVRWATGYTKMLNGAAKAGKEPSSAGVKTHARLLEKIATADAAISQDALGLRDALLSSTNDLE